MEDNAKGDVGAILETFAQSGADQRCENIEQIGELADERVERLLLEVIADPSEDEIVRVEALKAIPFRRDSEEACARFADAILAILSSDEDELVRQFAALAMRKYVNLEGVVEKLEEVVRNESEEEAVRHNALSALERNARIQQCRRSLERLASLPEFSLSIQRTLLRFHNDPSAPEPG